MAISLDAEGVFMWNAQNFTEVEKKTKRSLTYMTENRVDSLYSFLHRGSCH